MCNGIWKQENAAAVVNKSLARNVVKVKVKVKVRTLAIAPLT